MGPPGLVLGIVLLFRCMAALSLASCASSTLIFTFLVVNALAIDDMMAAQLVLL